MPEIKIERARWWSVILLAIGGFMLTALIYSACQFAVQKAPSGFAVPLGFLLGAFVLAAYAAIVKLSEGRWTSTLRLSQGPGMTAKGMGIGILYFLSVTALIALCGCYRIEKIEYSAGLWSSLSLFFLVACGEEIMFRGILFRMIDKKWGTTTALIASALIFGGVHIANPGATLWSSAAIAIEAGLLLGVAYKCSGSLWMPIGIHWIWNFMEGPVLGFAVSGGNLGSPLITPVIQGPDFITGGSFGAEASILAAALGVALSLLIWHRYKKAEN